MTPVRVVLADDHRVVREGLRLLLEAQPGFSVVGESSDGLEAVGLVERLKPEIAIVDLVLPGLGGLDVTREVRKRSPKTRVVILSMHSSAAYVAQALRNGASSFVLKEASATELVVAVREALAGRRHLSPPLSEEAVRIYETRAEAAGTDPYESLTARERHVLHLAAEGLSSAAIGERLGIGARTAETHRAHLMEKLGLRNRTDLILYAVRREIIPRDSGQ